MERVSDIAKRELTKEEVLLVFIKTGLAYHNMFLAQVIGENLDAHAFMYGLSRKENESDEELRKRVLEEMEKNEKEYLNPQLHWQHLDGFVVDNLKTSQ